MQKINENTRRIHATKTKTYKFNRNAKYLQLEGAFHFRGIEFTQKSDKKDSQKIGQELPPKGNLTSSRSKIFTVVLSTHTATALFCIRLTAGLFTAMRMR